MTTYSSFIRDFPLRCRDFLVAYEDDAKQRDREVTLLITVATSAFIIPFERLNPSSPDHVADDRYPKAVSKLGRLQNRDFVSWQKGTSWRIIEDLDGQQIRNGQADGWASPDKRCPIPIDKKVSSVLSIIRNALAHGSIFTYPNTHPQGSAPQIEHIIFLSRLREKTTSELINKYKVVVASPSDFRALILDWISFLESLKLPSEIMQESV